MGIFDSIGDAFSDFGNDVKSGFTTAGDAIANVATTGADAVANVAKTGADDVANVATQGADAVANTAKDVGGKIAGFATGDLKNFALGALGKAMSLIGLGPKSPAGSDPNDPSTTLASYGILIAGGIIGLIVLLLVLDLLGKLF